MNGTSLGFVKGLTGSGLFLLGSIKRLWGRVVRGGGGYWKKCNSQNVSKMISMYLNLYLHIASIKNWQFFKLRQKTYLELISDKFKLAIGQINYQILNHGDGTNFKKIRVKQRKTILRHSLKLKEWFFVHIYVLTTLQNFPTKLFGSFFLFTQ